MKTVQLNNGVEMPILGYGVYQITPDECERCVLEAIDAGYRSIDTAQAYRNEEGVGNAVRKSGIPRKEFFITTKVWISNAGYDRAKASIDESLRKLQTDYIDLLLVHQPFGDVYGSWRAMEELYKKGVSRAIGVSNFHPDRVIDLILHNKVVPAVNQIETHPFLQQIETQKFLQENKVRIESWGPLAEGENNIFTNDLLLSLAGKHKKTVAQIILRWLIQRDVIAIPKTVRKERMKENFDIFDFELSAEDMEEITTLDTKQSLFLDHNAPETVKMLSSWIV